MSEFRDNLRFSTVETLLRSYCPAWTLSERVNFNLFVIEDVMFKILVNRHCQVNGIPPSIIEEKSDEMNLAEFNLFEENARECITDLNICMKTYYMAGYTIYKR
jgi:hypothetical protein